MVTFDAFAATVATFAIGALGGALGIFAIRLVSQARENYYMRRWRLERLCRDEEAERVRCSLLAKVGSSTN
jgi:hypothetical protein